MSFLISNRKIRDHEIVRLFTEYMCGCLPWEVVLLGQRKGVPFFAQTFEIGRCLGEAELRWIYAYRCMYLKKLAHK